jgi:hypothetical protein
MTRSAAFCLGAALLGAVAGLLFAVFPLAGRNDEAERWRVRALEAERHLSSLRSRVDSLSAQSESTPARLDSREKPLAGTTSPAQGPPAAPAKAPPPLPLPRLDATVFDPARQHEWDALITGTLQSEVQQRLGHTSAPEQEQRLVGALARLRDASLGLNRELSDPEDPAAERSPHAHNCVTGGRSDLSRRIGDRCVRLPARA